MKKFSKKWKSSKNPKKQRKYRANAPLHIRGNMVSANLSKTLRERYGKRSIGLRKNDVVKILTGNFKGQSGKVLDVDRKNYKITIEDINRTQSSGREVNVPIDPSNVQITELNKEDRKRIKKLKSKKQSKSDM